MIRDTLLIIDDSELDLAILHEIFKNLFRVECVSDARLGLSFLHQHEERVCAVLLDICLERRGEGFTVLHQFQSDPTTASLPVILITTDANEQDVRASVERGAVDFLVKPVNPHTVQERVCGVVRGAWPANTTILDQEPDSGAGQPVSPDPEEDALQRGRTRMEEAQEQWREWTRKLEAFCRLRPGLDAEAHRQLGVITDLLARRYAEAFPQKLSQEDATLIGMAAVFCDIGLLGLPDHVMEQGEHQEGLDAQTYYQHIWLGYELLNRDGQEFPLFRYAAEIALWHHKNVDGSGYPQDADASAVPLSAQLTHTALRIQHYLRYYRGCGDGVERMLRALKGEVGTIVAPELYQVAEMENSALETILQSV